MSGLTTYEILQRDYAALRARCEAAESRLLAVGLEREQDGKQYLAAINKVAELEAALKIAEGAVPTNWCDVLLTGPGAGPFTDYAAVERLLGGLRDRISAIASNALAGRTGGEDNA